MEKLIRVTGTAAPLMIDNIDTDAITPTPWLTKAGVSFGRALFAHWRYEDEDGERVRGDFILNREPFSHARILIAGANFGCGSSREHAVWALREFGIRSVIAPSFSDIFYDNAFKNGLLAIRLPAETVAALGRSLEAGQSGHDMTVDLEQRTIIAPDGRAIAFEIDPARRIALLEGLDEIGLTLKDEAAIAAFQRRDRAARPWIHEAAFGA